MRETTRKAHKAMRKVMKKLGVNIKDIMEFDGRYVATDTFTNILMSLSGNDIKLWAVAHRDFIDANYENIKSGSYIPRGHYDKIMFNKLKVCQEKPKVELLYEGSLDGYDVIAYTDNTDALVLQAKNFKGA